MYTTNARSSSDLKARLRELNHSLGRLPESEASESDRRALRREIAQLQAEYEAAVKEGR